MIIGRVILYDRLYHHHKVRAAEAMVRALVDLAAVETQRPLTLEELFCHVSDDAVTALLSGEITSDGMRSGQSRSKSLGKALLTRQIYHRAFAFADRFIGGLEGLSEKERNDTRGLKWSSVKSFIAEDGARSLASEVHDKAVEIAAVVPELTACADGLSREHILVDLPANRAVVRGSDILTRTEGGHISTPNLFFNPERWAVAYEHQKHGGYVFCQKSHMPLVALAASVVFFEKFSIFMSAEAASICKTTDLVDRAWIEQVGKAGLCSAECIAALKDARPILHRIRADELKFPGEWRLADPEMTERISRGLRTALPGGLPATIHKSLIDALAHLTSFVDMCEKGGELLGVEGLTERDLQHRLRNHLRSREVEVLEGAEIGGGETDLVLPGPLVVENKVRRETTEPIDVGDKYVWQARRYSIAVCASVCFVIVGYRPASEKAILPLPQRMEVVVPEGAPESFAEIRIVLPYGHVVPSSAKTPKAEI